MADSSLLATQPHASSDDGIEESTNTLLAQTRDFAAGDDADLISRYGDLVGRIAQLQDTGLQLRWLDHLVDRLAIFCNPKGSEKPESLALVVTVLRGPIRGAVDALVVAPPDPGGHNLWRGELGKTIDRLIDLSTQPGPISLRRTDRTFHSPLDVVPDAVAGAIKSFLGVRDRARMNGVSQAARARFGEQNAAIGECHAAYAAERKVYGALRGAAPARHWYSPPDRRMPIGRFSKLKEAALTKVLWPVVKGARKKDSEAYTDALHALNSLHKDAFVELQNAEAKARLLVKPMLAQGYNPAAAKLLDALELFRTAADIAALKKEGDAAINAAVEHLWTCLTAEALSLPGEKVEDYDAQSEHLELQRVFQTRGLESLGLQCNFLHNRIVNAYTRWMINA